MQKEKKETSEYILHYTCNAPCQEILDKYKIRAVGEQYGLYPREMLEIPIKLLKKMGYDVKNSDRLSLSSHCEHLLVRIEHMEKEKAKQEKRKNK